MDVYVYNVWKSSVSVHINAINCFLQPYSAFKNAQNKIHFSFFAIAKDLNKVTIT